MCHTHTRIIVVGLYIGYTSNRKDFFGARRRWTEETSMGIQASDACEVKIPHRIMGDGYLTQVCLYRRTNAQLRWEKYRAPTKALATYSVSPSATCMCQQKRP